MGGSGVSARFWMPVLLMAGGLVSVPWAQQLAPLTPTPLPAGERGRGEGARLDSATVKQFVTKHCTSCHNSDDKRAGLALDALSSEDVGAHPAIWEKVVRKLATR